MTQLALVLLVACSAAESGQKPPRTAAQLRADARRDLDAIGVKIDALESRARAEGEESRERLEAQIGTLRSKKGKAEELLKKLEGAAAEAGKDVQAELDGAIRELKRACREVRSKFGRSHRKSASSLPTGP